MSDLVAAYPALPRAEATGLPKTLALCLSEARPVVQVIFLMRFGAGVALGWDGAGRPTRILTGFACWACAVLFAYLINGVLDIAEDRVNGSRRPIARGDLDPHVAAGVAYTAAAVAEVLGFGLGLRTGFLVTAFVVCGYVYSAGPFCLKRWTGTTAAGVIVLGLTTYAGGYSVATGPEGGPGRLPLLVFALAMSLWMGLVGALVKDLSDVAGDRAAGRRTVACRGGEHRVRTMVAAFATCLGGVFVVVAARYAPALLPPAVATLAGGAAVAALLLARCSTGDRARRRRPYHGFMVTQYTAHLALFGAIIL